MATIVLIACASQKLSHPARAGDLYTSTLFKLNLTYAKLLRPDQIQILSAKHGLLDLDTVIEPYDVTLNTMPAVTIRGWSQQVHKQLAGQYNLRRDHFVFLAGDKYRKYLLPHLTSYQIPLLGLPIGKQLQFLKQQIEEMNSP